MLQLCIVSGGAQKHWVLIPSFAASKIRWTCSCCLPSHMSGASSQCMTYGMLKARVYLPFKSADSPFHYSQTDSCCQSASGSLTACWSALRTSWGSLHDLKYMT